MTPSQSNALIFAHLRGGDRYVGVAYSDGAAILDTRPGDGEPPKVVRDQLPTREALKLLRQFNDNSEAN